MKERIDNPQAHTTISQTPISEKQAEAGIFDYGTWLRSLKQRIREAQVRAAIAVNTELVRLYWQIGHEILLRQQQQGWGAKVVERLAKDLKAEFPEMTGFSRANIMYMRAFAAAWTEEEIVQAPLGQLTWYHHLTLLDKLDTREQRLAYARLAAENGWSRNVMVHHIELKTAARSGKAQTNFQTTLPAPDSDLAQQQIGVSRLGGWSQGKSIAAGIGGQSDRLSP